MKEKLVVAIFGYEIDLRERCCLVLDLESKQDRRSTDGICSFLFPCITKEKKTEDVSNPEKFPLNSVGEP